jgi:hypothetical protein
MTHLLTSKLPTNQPTDRLKQLHVFRYGGTSRCGYLPDSPEGRGACALLVKGFLAGQLFVVGDSVTTGATNCVVWGGVHQKTSPSGGAHYHGWPDPTYFERLMHECAAVGVFTDSHEKAMLDATVKARKAASASASGSAAKTVVTTPPAVAVSACDAAGASAIPVSSTGAGSVDAESDINRLQQRVTELITAVQAATRAQDVTLVRSLMAQRAEAQALLKRATNATV